MPPFSLVLILIVGWLVQRRNERVGRLLFTLGAVVFILIFMPITGKVAIQPLLHAVKPWVPGDPIMPEVVLIPTGGAFEDQNHRWWPNNYSVSRMTSGLDLHKRYGLPLIISGGPMPGSQDSEAKILFRFFNLEETADIRLEQQFANHLRHGAKCCAAAASRRCESGVSSDHRCAYDADGGQLTPSRAPNPWTPVQPHGL